MISGRAIVTAGVAVLVLGAGGATTAALAASGPPSTVYVTAGADDSGTCATAASACGSISYALHQVATGGSVEISGTFFVNGTAGDGDTSGGGIEIYRDVTFAAAPHATSATIDGEGTNWLFYVNNGAYVTFDGVTLENGSSTQTGVGGAITNGGVGTISISNSTLTGNTATGNDAGGAVSNNASGTIDVSGSTFTDNDASDHGAAIDNADAETGTVNVSDSSFTGNGVGNGGNANGGAIDNGDDGGSGTLTVSGSTFSGNDGWNGGAIDTGQNGSGQDSVTITDSTFSKNASYPNGGESGGAINSTGATKLTISGSTFTDNTTTGAGGAIANEGDATVTGSAFTGNAAVGLNGGAIDNSGTMTISGTQFNSDTSGQFGGAVDNDATLTIANSSFDGNTAYDSGGAIASPGDGGTAMLTVSGSTFTGNVATWYNGGAIDNADITGTGVAVVSDSTFSGNAANVAGGAIDNGDDSWDAQELPLNSDGTLTVLSSTFAANTAAVGATIDNGDNTGTGVVYAAADLFDGSCGNNTVDSIGAAQKLTSTGGTWTDQGDNATTDASCLGGSALPSDTVGAGVGSDLGALANNGGPTETMMPSAGNPAIGLIGSGATVTAGPSGSSSDLTVSCPFTADQRGTLKAPPSGTACDAGSVQSWGIPASTTLSSKKSTHKRPRKRRR